jgi:hypothetical protein
MAHLPQGLPSRKQIAVRMLFTLFFLLVLEILKIIVQGTVLFQYVYLLIAGSYSMPLKKFSNALSVYMYRLIRYVTLNENEKPFPFSSIPEERDPPDPEILF